MSRPDSDPGLLEVRIVTSGEEEWVSLTLEGELCLVTASLLRDAVAAVMGGDYGRVVVELSRLTFCDATGVRALVRAAEDLHARGGTLELHRPRRHVWQVLQLCQVDEVPGVTVLLDPDLTDEPDRPESETA